MNHLKNKSELSIISAEFLHRQSLYASGIHCSYYSCLQLMKHIMSRDTETVSKPPGASHTYIINYFTNRLKVKHKHFSRDIYTLKKLRINADYEEIYIDTAISRNAIALSKSINNILKSSFPA